MLVFMCYVFLHKTRVGSVKNEMQWNIQLNAYLHARFYHAIRTD